MGSDMANELDVSMKGKESLRNPSEEMETRQCAMLDATNRDLAVP